ncbi:MAG: RHS repeat domain-containing protein, partial [Methylomicrobium sp.]
MPPKKQNGITTAFAYGYDAVGNRLQETVGSQTTAATYNDLNQLLTNGSDSYRHDDDGNQNERHSATLGSHSYLWDAENRLVALEDLHNPATHSDLAYDALGRRIGIKDQTNGTTTKDARLIYCGTTLCAENDYLTNSFTRYYGDGASIEGEGVYYHRDHLGSVRAVTDAGGAVKASYAYDPYGRRTTITGNATDSIFGYTGHYVHSATGLALAPYRAYDADIGRWLSRDPIGERGGINLYNYVGNNPINAIDTLGLAKNCGDEPDCAKVKDSCIEECSDSSLPTKDYGFTFWNCVNRCMAAHGCGSDVQMSPAPAPTSSSPSAFPWWIPLIPLLTPWPDPY